MIPLTDYALAWVEWVTGPIRAVDDARVTQDSEETRRLPLTAEHHEGETLWRIESYDDQPIPDGNKYAADVRVVLLRDGERVREFTYPSYRIWTLLAHWTDGLADFEEAP